MLKISDDKCTGCTLCENICPTNAIEFEVRNGFRYPKIDKKKCIDCGLCERKCPALNKQNNENVNEDRHIYAAWTKNVEQREKCTSGGICYELSKYVLENKGCVAGVAWMPDYKDAQYELIEDIKDLDNITQTKYFQPKMNGIYEKVKEKLEQGVTVLFIGSACSNAALKSYLSKDYPNLYCCDFICRGYTSQLYHERRIEYLEKLKCSKINGVQYKNKDKGWTCFGTKFYFQNGTEYYINRFDDSYELMFKVCDLNTRPSCYECKYRTMPRQTDITVGDFWAIQNIEDVNIKLGVSAVFTFNVKGSLLFDAIKNKIEYEERTIGEVSKGNYALIHNISKPIVSSQEFYQDLNSMNFPEFEKKYASKRVIKMKKVKNILKIMLRCNLLSFIKINFMTKGVVRKRNKYLFPFYGTRVQIQGEGKLIINDNIFVNTPKHVRSNEQAYIKIMNGGVFKIDGKSNIAANATIEVLPDAELTIGGIETNYGVTIICSNKIIIGNEVAIGRNAVIYDSNYHPTSINNNQKLKPLLIKDHVWICSGVTITKGITIEEGAVCGINSTVTRNVKNKNLVMGNPAKAFISNIEW